VKKFDIPNARVTAVEAFRLAALRPRQKESLMRAKARKTWRARVIAFIAIPAAIIGITVGSAVAASAAPAAASLPQTCTFYHGHVGGSFDALDSYTSRNLAWAEASSTEGTPVSLARYRDTLNQCWHLLGGFGNGEFEIADTNNLCITENSNHDAGVPLVLELCLSKKTQLYKNFTPISRFQLVNSPKLCIGLSETIKAGAVLYQQTCNSKSPGQHWFLNTSP
jgi:hypothetical protein